MTALVVVMLAGFAGSFHCIGMCGGFACALGPALGGSPVATTLRHLLYNLGRLVTYAFIGALAGLLGTALVGQGLDHHAAVSPDMAMQGGQGHRTQFFLAGEMGLGQRLLALAAGGFMVVMALQLFGVMRHLPASWAGRGSGFFVPAFRSLLTSRSAAAPVTLGMMNGFLPCPLVFAFAALAAASGTIQSGILTMVAFGLGTFPAMLFMGSLGRILAPAARRGGLRLAGSFILIIGFVTILRGVAPTLLHLGGHGT